MKQSDNDQAGHVATPQNEHTWNGSRRIPPWRRSGLFEFPSPRTIDEKGSAAFEMVAIMPALLLLIVVGVQFALWGLAAHAVALASSDAGAQARASDGSASAAQTAAEHDLTGLGSGLVEHSAITATGEPGGDIAVSVSGEVPQIIPGVRFFVHASSIGPVQQFRAHG
jgi:hypothetical protein